MDQAPNTPSSDTLGFPNKRKRGRPRKDQSANRLAITRVPHLQRGGPTNQPNDGFVGHAVTGVVDAAFDAGYLLSVRIGNAIFRGVVFKPGNAAPVTLENDVAPHVQVIRRNDIHVPANNIPGSSTVQNGSPSTNQWLALEHRTTSMTTTPEGKYASPAPPSVFPVGARATVAPVVLQPASLSNDFTPTPQLTSASSQDLGVDDGVYTVEPLAMLPSVSSYQTLIGQNQALPSRTHVNQQGAQAGGLNGNVFSVFSYQTAVCQNQALPSQTHVNQQGAQAGVLNGNVSSAGVIMANQEDVKQLESAETHAQDYPGKGPQDSHPPSEIHDYNLCESNMSHGHPSQHVHPSLSEQSVTVSQPLGRYPTGRMTELLLALQENMMENQEIHDEPSSSTSTVDPDEDESEEDQ